VYLKLKSYCILNILIGENSLTKNKNNCTKKVQTKIIKK